jgi:negative regulator of flagellin synthesis FlgM
MRIVSLQEFSGAIVRREPGVSAAAKAAPAGKNAAEAHEAQAPVATSRLVAPGDVPVDQDRVAEIRKALETGTYPLIPTKVADAIIAAGMYGKVGK